MDKSVSVIAPAYNHEKYIESCLWSIAKQNCKEMELIVLDDCSKDRTRVIIEKTIKQKEFCDRFSMGVRFIPHQKNKGAHDTINEGLMMAKGNYLAVINTDDAFGEHHLELLLDACEENGSEFAFGGIRVIDEHDEPVTEGYGKAIMKYQDTARMCPTITMGLTRGNSTISTGNMVFTARLYRKLGGFRNYKYVHDWDFALRSALITEPVFVPEAYYVYRLHGGNTISEIAGRPEDANRMENEEDGPAPNPLIEFLQKVLKGEYTNMRIPSLPVWEYFFQYKKYYSDDIDAKWAWAEAKRLCKSACF
mgnify:CR=1 FL=1